MKKTAIIIVLIVIAIIVYIRKRRQFFAHPQPDTDTSRPTIENLPPQQKQNDKLVMVKGINYEDLKRVLTGFCNVYNKEKYQALPRLTKLSESEFVITFPTDIDFEILCYFVNYIKYPVEIPSMADVLAWTTTKQGDAGIPRESLNKKIMLFISANDTEYDNVFMTNSDNVGYKLDFSMNPKKRALEMPEKPFISPPVELSELDAHEYEDFK
jgi:hypothetical protein